MPFDLAPKEANPAQRLAALIEAGAAANPDLRFDGAGYFCPFEKRACALAFAALANGAQRNYSDIHAHIDKLAGPMGNKLRHSIEIAAIDPGATISGICESLRVGALSKIAA